MVAMQIACEPLVRQALRQVYQTRAVLNVKPTKTGRKVREISLGQSSLQRYRSHVYCTYFCVSSRVYTLLASYWSPAKNVNSTVVGGSVVRGYAKECTSPDNLSGESQPYQTSKMDVCNVVRGS